MSLFLGGRRAAPPRVIAPVEVDAPGCSYNPDRAQHQEAVARAVAEENAKLIDAELQAQPPPKHVDWHPETDPMMAFQVGCRALVLVKSISIMNMYSAGPLYFCCAFSYF